MSENDSDNANETVNETENNAAEPVTSTDGAPAKESRQMAMFAHLSALVGFLIPFGNLIAPLIIWQMKKEDPFVDAQGKEAVNFQITVSIAGIVAAVLTVVLIGLLLLPVIAIGSLVLVIIAGLKANEGENYQYPFALRLIK